ncbi:MAG: hypothetical protein LUQ14_01310 [Methanomassiliicoccales archaeon]|nr:hypothetical protein [Methanomassiliicoccales archaeon]
MPLLLNMMLKEEYRMHVTYSSRTIFLALPMFIVFIAFGMGVSLHQLERNISIQELLTLTHVGIFLYGLSVGAFGFLGKTYVERRFGKNNYVINMPAILPLSFKRTFLGMFLRDVIFYVVIVLLPALLGLLLAAPIAHFSVLSIGGVFLALLLSFLIGVSFSFAVSVIYTRSVKAFVAVVLAFIALVIGYGVFDLYSMQTILPALAFQVSIPPLGRAWESALLYLGISIAVVASFTIVATLLVRESLNGGKSQYDDKYPGYYSRFVFARSYQELLAKEFVDLVRSGTIGKMVFSFVAPLVFLSFSTWYVNYGLAIPVGFNTVFYATMVGFFGVLLYSWLTNIDLMDYFETLPVSVPQVIRTKLLAFLFLTLGISTAFVLVIAWINGEMQLLWLALPVLYVTSTYMVVATAYLTGLNPNSFLFNPEILVKFAAVSILPDLCLTILSFSVLSGDFTAFLGIALVLGVLVACTWFFHRGIEEKWSKTSFP